MRTQNLLAIAPELFLVVAGIAIILIDSILKGVKREWLALLAGVGIVTSTVATVVLWNWDGGPTALQGMIATDRLAVVGRLIILGVALIGVLLGYDYFKGEERGEFYALLLFATTGMTLLVSSADLLMVFLGLEILSLALYVLCGFTLRLGSAEASLKYFLLGAFSSAVFLYGLAMTYGATGTTKINGIVGALTGQTQVSSLALVAIGLLGAGFAFKVSAVPFHMWTPDVYQGAPTAVTSFMSAGTKVAAFVALIRVLDVAFQPLTWNWVPVVQVLAVVTMIVGALLSIVQKDVKRLLAYSSITNAGFILVGFSAGPEGIVPVLFYLVSYAAMVIGAFGVVMVVSGRDRERSSIEGFTGLGRRAPLLGALMTVFLVSLTGIPLTAGFLAKILVFGAAAGAGQWPLVLVAVLAAVIASFAYLRVIVRMYMRDPEPDAEVPQLSPVAAVAIWVPAVVTILFGIMPALIAPVLEQAAVLNW